MMQYDDLYQFEGDATIYISSSNDYVDYVGAFIWCTHFYPYITIYIFIKKYFFVKFVKRILILHHTV